MDLMKTTMHIARSVPNARINNTRHICMSKAKSPSASSSLPSSVANTPAEQLHSGVTSITCNSGDGDHLIKQCPLFPGVRIVPILTLYHILNGF